MKIKLPWYTCSRIVEAFRDLAEPEEVPNSTGALERINEREATEETMPESENHVH